MGVRASRVAYRRSKGYHSIATDVMYINKRKSEYEEGGGGTREYSYIYISLPT